MKYKIRTRKEGHLIELNDVGDSQRSRDFARYSASLRSPRDSRLLIDAYSRSKSTGRKLGTEIVLLSVRGPRLYEPTPEELGEKEKARILKRLEETDLSEEEAFILRRTEPQTDEKGNRIWSVDLVLNRSGIYRYLRMALADGTQSPALTTEPIPVADYPLYSELANQAIDRRLAEQNPH